jgi:hypothetical protein
MHKWSQGIFINQTQPWRHTLSSCSSRQDDADHYTVVSKLITAKGAKTMAMNPVNKNVYLPTVISGQFVVLVAARKN